jgi:hypothetical protein
MICVSLSLVISLSLIVICLSYSPPFSPFFSDYSESTKSGVLQDSELNRKM